jgi:hypothetical protein
MLEQVVRGLPRAWTVAAGGVPASAQTAAVLSVVQEPNAYMIHDADGVQTRVLDGALAGAMLRTMLRRAVAASLTDLTCVEATVVRYQGRGLVLTGEALGGTTTLARTLVAAGAEHHADEFALIDADGMLMSDLDARPGSAVDRTVPVGLVAMTLYRPGAEWTPQRLTQAEAVVALMAYVQGAHERPANTLAALRRALADATVLKGDRGEASDAAAGLLQTAVADSPIKSS